MAGSSKKCFTFFFLLAALGIPITIFQIINPNQGEQRNNPHHGKDIKKDKHGNIIDTCMANDSLSREEVVAVIKYLSLDRPERLIIEHDERKGIGIAAVVVTIMAYFYMWCICCRMEDFEKDIQSNENLLEKSRKKTIKKEALKKIREELDAKQKMTVEDVELESLKSKEAKSNNNHEVEQLQPEDDERKVVVINTDDLDYQDDGHQPEINIANSVVYINNSRAPTPAFDRVSMSFTPAALEDHSSRHHI